MVPMIANLDPFSKFAYRVSTKCCVSMFMSTKTYKTFVLVTSTGTESISGNQKIDEEIKLEPLVQQQTHFDND